MRNMLARQRHHGAKGRAIPCGLFAVLVLMSACYSTHPVVSPTPVRESRIYGRLTDQASREMGPLIGQDALAVEGIVAEIRENEWDLLLLRVDQTRDRSVRWNRERVAFPAGAFANVVERRLQKTRSAMFAGGLTAGVILVAQLIGLGGLFSGGDNGGNPGPVE